ncbi:MAG: thiamine phosphate synthase [Nanoarchaeota archaeon]
MPKLKDFGLYFITDSRLTRKTVIEDVKSAIKGGVKIIQYREKDASKEQMLAEAKEIKKLCKKNSVIFLVNDRIDIALESDADGVHLGQDDENYETARKLLGKNKIIGLTTHDVRESVEAEKLGADYIGLSPIFPTSTKADAGKACGTEMIAQVKKYVKIPVVAVGGINESNISQVLKAGAKNLAIISAILTKDDVEKAVKEFQAIINSHK